MEKWNTRLFLKTKQELMQSQPIQIRRGIFQGDSLSPLLFCIALITLTNKLNRADCGYQVHGTERKISHLLYMDDLKLLGRNENDLKNEIKIVHTMKKRFKYEFWFRKMCKNMFKEVGSKSPTMLPAGGRQHHGCIIPQAVTHSLVLLKMGKIIS